MNDITNMPAGFAGLCAEALDLIERYTRFAEAPEIDPKIGRDLIAAEVNLRQRFEASKKAEKAPHLEANAEIEARYKEPLGEIHTGVQFVKRRLEEYIRAETRQREAAERAAREAAERAAIAAEEAARAAAPDDPFATLAAEEAAESAAEQARAAERARQESRVKIGGYEQGRALSARKHYRVEVADARALVTFFIDSPGLIEAARMTAEAMVRGAKGQNPAGIPGIKIITEERL